MDLPVTLEFSWQDFVPPQHKIAGARGQKAQKGTLGPGGRLRGGKDCSGTRSFISQWNRERKENSTKENSVLSGAVASSGWLSLEEVLAPFQQTWIQVWSTGVAKEEQDFCPPFQSTIRVLQGSFNGIDNT